MTDRSNALREAVLFFALTLGLTFFVFWGPLALFRVPTISFVDDTTGPAWALALFITGGFVPSLVAVVLTAAREGLGGLRRLVRRVIQVRIGWRWYLAAIVLVGAGSGGQILILALLGRTFDFSLFVAQLGTALPLIVLGPLSEELGWRGYALDRLQTKMNPLFSGLVVGVVWAVWHLPLFSMVGSSQAALGIPFPGFFVGVTALSLLFTWLHNNTGGSIWTAIFFHWIYTYSTQVVASGATRSPLYNWLEYAPYVILAVIVTVVWRLWSWDSRAASRSARAADVSASSKR